MAANLKLLRRLELGKVCATPGAIDVLDNAGVNPDELLRRHFQGDWGDLCEEDHRANVDALADGDRVLSSYILTSGVKVWIITEADRSVTTILLPEDY